MTSSVESVYDVRGKIFDAVQEGRIGREIFDLLISQGVASNDEAPLWDYKGALPVKPAVKNDGLKLNYDVKMAEIVKDCVSFWNAYGGYLVAGVHDKTRKIIGYDADFDAADLNLKIHAATGVSIETIYRRIDVSNIEAGKIIGLLLIPRRPNSSNPAQFRKDAPKLTGSSAKPAYAAQSFYLRQRDQCRPAVSPEDFEFLYGPRTLAYEGGQNFWLDNNLPPRDTDMIQLIGRNEELANLWGWLSDAFRPVKILAGLGGVGKTSIAFTFSERLIERPPAGLDRLIWLGAKVETFSGEQGRFVTLVRTDFASPRDLLMQILLETGCPPEQVPDDPAEDELLSLCEVHLRAFGYMLVVDNLDTLADEDQQVVYDHLTQLAVATRTKCLITARRNLGATKAAVIEIGGLSKDDFEKFVGKRCELLGVAPPTDSEMTALRAASGGSPLFAMSLLRLVSLGDSYQVAIAHWRGSDGEKVREAAFKAEVSRLSGPAARVLLVLCYRPAVSASELTATLKLNRQEIHDAIDELRQFSMTSEDHSLPGGASFRLSPTLSFVTSLVEKRVGDHAEIKEHCTTSEKVVTNKRPFIAEAERRVLSFLSQNNHSEAAAVVQQALLTLPDDPDLIFLQGRCFTAAGSFHKARDSYALAYDLGCRRRELFAGWIEASRRENEWRGITDIATKAEEATRLCSFRCELIAATVELGHAACRVGDIDQGIGIYERALDHARLGLEIYRQPGDRAELWRLNTQVVVAWLGASRRRIGEYGTEYRTFFIYCEALLKHRLNSMPAAHSALEQLSGWLDKVQTRRRPLSETAAHDLERAGRRLDRLMIAVEHRAGFENRGRDQFLDAADDLKKRIEEVAGSR